MTDPSKVHVPKVVKSTNKMAMIDGWGALGQIVDAARECLLIHEQEASKRAVIRAYETTEVARIRAAEGVLRNYFDQVFAERREIYRELFMRLDRALDDGNGQALHDVVDSIVDIARQSPLAQMGDLGKLREALDDPDQVWDL